MDYVQRDIDIHNTRVGNLQGLDCAKCLNRGDIAISVEEFGRVYFTLKPCECRKTRETMQQIAASGLSELMERYTFANYKANAAWQQQVLYQAKAFLQIWQGRWFFAGGQVGSGKTHLCTAIVGELLKQGVPARYFVWSSDSKPIKAVVNDDAAYEKAVKPLKTVDVLYIDDFLKVRKGEEPTNADIRLAFEILNHRYNDSRLTTLLSSEFTIDEICDFDEATGSRIYERAKGNTMIIGQARDRNYRTRKELEHG